MPVLFVTGAGKGIGRAIAERFLGAGWQVAGLTRSAADVEALNGLGAGARFWQADAADPQEVHRIAAALGEALGGAPGGALGGAPGGAPGDAPLDLLVNNAGAFHHGGFRDTAPQTLEAMWRANVLGAFTVTQALLPLLLRSRGRIANIVSLAALKPLPGKAAYCAAKAAQAALFGCLRQEIAAEGVTVTNVYPGLTYTHSF
ncbi:MAG TPA: SDR family oxidoreductase, partial [Thermohalobaculum sp.]|nr:SDR family oxidoreductase [Thermohalobaculum sp.]